MLILTYSQIHLSLNSRQLQWLSSLRSMKQVDFYPRPIRKTFYIKRSTQSVGPSLMSLLIPEAQCLQQFAFVANSSCSFATSFSAYQPRSTQKRSCRSAPIVVDFILFCFICRGGVDSRDYCRKMMMMMLNPKAKFLLVG